MPHVTSADGCRIFYTTFGEGEPLLLAHGATHSWQSWRNLGYVDALQQRYLLILHDLRGHGESDKPHDRDAYSMSRQKDDVLAVLDDLAVDSCHYWGHSMGGRIGFAVLKTHPESIRSFIGWGEHPYAPADTDREFVGFLTGLFRDGMGGLIEFMESSGSLAAYRDPEERRRIVLDADGEAIVADCERFLEEPGLDDALSEIRTPVLMMAGEHDEAVDLVQQAARDLPCADFVRLYGLTHFMCPCDPVLPYVQAFLQRVEHGMFMK